MHIYMFFELFYNSLPSRSHHPKILAILINSKFQSFLKSDKSKIPVCKILTASIVSEVQHSRSSITLMS